MRSVDAVEHTVTRGPARTTPFTQIPLPVLKDITRASRFPVKPHQREDNRQVARETAGRRGRGIRVFVGAGHQRRDPGSVPARHIGVSARTRVRVRDSLSVSSASKVQIRPGRVLLVISPVTGAYPAQERVA
jgi:hypothetical protein